MMSDDPDAAKAKLASNKEAQLAKYTAIKHKGASDTFRQYVKAKMTHGALTDHTTKTAQMLDVRVKHLREDLSRNEHFENKALLDHTGPILINTHGHPFHEGAAFTMEGSSKVARSSEPSTWRVTGVDVEKRKVTLKPVGHVATDLYDDPTTTVDLQDLESGATPTDPVSASSELKFVVSKLLHPVALKEYPPAMIEEHIPAIQDRLRTLMAHKTDMNDRELRNREALWGYSDEAKRIREIKPGDAEAGTATYVLPNTPSMDLLVAKASEEKKSGQGSYSSYGRRGRYHLDTTYWQGLGEYYHVTDRDNLMKAYEKKQAEALVTKSKRLHLVFAGQGGKA